MLIRRTQMFNQKNLSDTSTNPRLESKKGTLMTTSRSNRSVKSMSSNNISRHLLRYATFSVALAIIPGCVADRRKRIMLHSKREPWGTTWDDQISSVLLIDANTDCKLFND